MIMLVTLLLVTVYVLNLVKEYTYNEKKVNLLTKANILASSLEEIDPDNGTSFKDIKNAHEIAGDARVMYLNRDLTVALDTSETGNVVGKKLALPQTLRALHGEGSAVQSEDSGKNYINAAVPVIKDSAVCGVVYLQAPADDMVNFFSHVKYNLLMLSGVVCIIVGLLSIAFSDVITAPISRIAVQLKEMSNGQIRKTIDVRGSNEVNQVAEEFNKMVEQLNTVLARRQEFVSNASHELKTPLSTIKLICDSILQNPDVDMAVVNEFLYDMNDEVDRLTRITNKHLSLTKLDASAEESEMMELSVINLKNMMRRIVKALKPLAESKNINLETLFDDEVFVTADPDKLWEAIYNIAENSIKYTENGGWVYVEMYRDAQKVYITVADNGIGMKEEETDKIFDRFYRVDKARARETGGTGLGLSIALSSVQLHGGEISVESHEGEGSLFRIIIPTVANPEAQDQENR